MKKLIVGFIFSCLMAFGASAYTISKMYVHKDYGKVDGYLTLRSDGSFTLQWEGESPIYGRYEIKEDTYGNDDRGYFYFPTDWGGEEKIYFRMIRPRETDYNKLQFQNMMWEVSY